MATTDTHRAIDAVWRIESPKLIAGLARIVRDVGVAEDLAHDALVAALEQWPESGVPDNPGAELVPQEPEVHGLVALLEIQASRLRARVGPSGEPIVLFDQNRALWDRLLIRRGLAALERAEKLGGARGPYALQAAIAACHARALARWRPTGRTWRGSTANSPGSCHPPSWS